MGDLILFPGSLVHEVLPCVKMGTELRVSIAFNMIGDKENTRNLVKLSPKVWDPGSGIRVVKTR